MIVLYTRLKAHVHCILKYLIGQKAVIVQVHFTLKGEGLRAQRNHSGLKVYINSYLANYKYYFRVLLAFVSSPPPRGRPNANSDRPCQWYILHTRTKALHNYLVMALGSCVKWSIPSIQGFGASNFQIQHQNLRR